MRFYQVLFSACLCVFLSYPALANTITELEKKSLEGQEKSTAIQNEIDQLFSEEQQIDQQYRSLLARLDTLNSANLDLKKRIESQDKQQQSLQRQLKSVAQVKYEITPLMNQMHSSLVEFVKADLPFLTEQRAQGLQQLADYLADIENSLSSKYQKILEAFEEQADFGHSMASFQGPLKIDGKQVQVNFLRLGRVALYYQTLDKERAARWSRQTESWIVLDAAQTQLLTKAVEMAQGTAITGLLVLNLQEPKLKGSEPEGKTQSGSESQ